MSFCRLLSVHPLGAGGRLNSREKQRLTFVQEVKWKGWGRARENQQYLLARKCLPRAWEVG